MLEEPLVWILCLASTSAAHFTIIQLTCAVLLLRWQEARCVCTAEFVDPRGVEAHFTIIQLTCAMHLLH